MKMGCHMRNGIGPIRVSIIGTGVGIRTYLPAFRRLQNVEVFAISGSSASRSEEFAAKYSIPNPMPDYKSLIDLPEVDLVCVASPNSYHFEHVAYAMTKNVNIICEKPLAMTMYEINHLIDLAKDYDKLALIDHQLRFNPYLRKVREIIQANLIGRPYFVKLHQQSTGYANRHLEWRWSFDAEAGGGVRLSMASHLIDLITYWFGNKYLTVRGAMGLVVPERRTKDGKVHKVTACSFLSASLAMENNLDIELSTTAASCGIPRFDFSIYGTDGELHFDLESKLRAAYLSSLGYIKPVVVDNVTAEERENKVSIFSGSFVYFAASIVEAITTKKNKCIEDASQFSDAYTTQVILDAIRDSALTGNTVIIKEGYRPGAEY